MNKLIFALFITFTASLANANFPITKIVNITKLEVWPSNNGTGRYGAYISPELTEAGCTNNTLFHIKDGPGAEAAYSTMLAAILSGKPIEVYVTECGYSPIVDRVRVIVN